ncbi:hypothetical protein Moror_13343 [Moniliophthora roreri MCA 2997]|uniref:Uncharacterized protein n=1 Tax=Moniliophthora roreri (strain MCA 2997) TaxID=1381753 RepID=V2XYW7_MONRO|nr:hypothetical protein Moror_13343 [Moniliophthora roreri MCA 2997]
MPFGSPDYTSHLPGPSKTIPPPMDDMAKQETYEIGELGKQTNWFHGSSFTVPSSPLLAGIVQALSHDPHPYTSMAHQWQGLNGNGPSDNFTTRNEGNYNITMNGGLHFHYRDSVGIVQRLPDDITPWTINNLNTSTFSDLSDLSNLSDLSDLAELSELSNLTNTSDLSKLSSLSKLLRLSRLSNLSTLILSKLSTLPGFVTGASGLSNLSTGLSCLSSLSSLSALSGLSTLSSVTISCAQTIFFFSFLSLSFLLS